MKKRIYLLVGALCIIMQLVSSCTNFLEVVTIEDNTHTFEMLVYPYSWHSGTNYIGTWRGKDTNNNNEVIFYAK